jgi:hypothetical protein
MLRELFRPVQPRGEVVCFSARSRSWLEAELGRIGAEPVGLGIGEPDVFVEESLKVGLSQTERAQLELPFERPVPAEDVQQDLWPEDLISRVGCTAVNKIAAGSGPRVDERDFLGIVTTPVLEEARNRARHLELRDLSTMQKAFRRTLVDVSSARSPQKVLWGEEPCVDALRLRYVGHIDWKIAHERRSADDVVWLGALEWLGRRFAGDGSKAPPKTRRVLATSVAASSGYRKALELLRSWPGKDWRFTWGSLIALRCVFDGWMVPDVVSSLIPPRMDLVPRLRKDSPWVPLSFALRWALQHGHQAGVVFALSAILTTAFRRSLESAAEQEGLRIGPPPWGSGALRKEQMVVFSDLLGRLCEKGWSPWKERPLKAAEEGTDLDLSELASILRRVLGGLDRFHFGLLCLDEHLLHATLFTLLGNLPSARVHLALSVRSPLKRGLAPPLKIEHSDRTLQRFLESSPLGSERAGVYSAIEGTPDPNVALGTPVWSFSDHLGDVASAFMRARKGPAFRSVRSLLQREDLKKAVRPYWLLSGRDKAGLVASMKWAGGLEPYPEEEAWWGFLESQARQVLEEKPWAC